MISVDAYLKFNINSLGKSKKNNYIALEKYKMKNYNPIINNPNLKNYEKTIIERIASVGNLFM